MKATITPFNTTSPLFTSLPAIRFMKFRIIVSISMADLGSIPLVLPHELVELSTADFIRKIQQHVFRLDHCYSSTQIDLVADEHKALIHAHRCEPVLKDGIDSLSSSSSFKDGWSLLGAWFPNLMEYCGVVATLFPGTSTVESNFSIMRWEKDLFRKRLSNFGLEGVMQAKQFLFIEQFQHWYQAALDSSELQEFADDQVCFIILCLLFVLFLLERNSPSGLFFLPVYVLIQNCKDKAKFIESIMLVSFR